MKISAIKTNWLFIALINFLIAASIGLILRYAFVTEVSWLKFKNFLHAHSHVAMLGWIYLAFYSLVFHMFTSKQQRQKRFTKRLFWATQFTVIGMLISFPLHGYSPISITFSGLHIIASYFFIYQVWPQLRQQKTFSSLLLRTAMIFLILSTIAIWAMGPIMSTSLRTTVLYYMAVQFYLHFQFNGWMIFAILAVFFKILEEHQIHIPTSFRYWFYRLLVASCILTFALALAWANPILPIFLINSLGVLLQLAAISLFIQWAWSSRKSFLDTFEGYALLLLRVALISFVLKVFAQSAVAIPAIARAAYTIRNYVIGFIHLILLGAISCAILAFALKKGLLHCRHLLSRLGLVFLISSFFLSEAILFVQGTMFWGAQGFIPYYYELLFLASAFIPIGVFLFIIGQFSPKTKIKLAIQKKRLPH